MKFISTEDFVLKQGELFEKDGQPQRIKLICNYAKFMKHELKIENFDPDKKECLFEGFKVEVDSYYDDGILYEITTDKEDTFLLQYNQDEDIFLDWSGDEMSLHSVQDLFKYCLGFGVDGKINLTRYAIKIFNL